MSDIRHSFDFHGVTRVLVSRDTAYGAGSLNEFHTRNIDLVDKDGKSLRITVYTRTREPIDLRTYKDDKAHAEIIAEFELA